MNIEKEIFKNSTFIESKLISYGFKYKESIYIYEKYINNNLFKVIISITNGCLNGKIIDLETNLEYTNYRVNRELGEFSSNIKNEYENILKDILGKCCKREKFIFNQSNRLSNLIEKKYNVIPEFLWDKYPNIGVFRNKKNNKWFGIIMNVDKSKIVKNTSGEVEVLNIKLDDMVTDYMKISGIYEAYHMSKKNWVSIILDDTLTDEYIMNLIDISFKLSGEK